MTIMHRTDTRPANDESKGRHRHPTLSLLLPKGRLASEISRQLREERDTRRQSVATVLALNILNGAVKLDSADVATQLSALLPALEVDERHRRMELFAQLLRDKRAADSADEDAARRGRNELAMGLAAMFEGSARTRATRRSLVGEVAS